MPAQLDRHEQLDRRQQLGIVCLHGLGGTPQSIAPLTAALLQAGYTTTAPLLCGHGTTPAKLQGFGWQDWLRDVVRVARSLHAVHDRIVFVGQSMGATLALAASLELPFIAGVAAINAPVLPPDPDATEHLEYLIERGRTMQPAGAANIRDPEAVDAAYDELPLSSLLEMGSGTASVYAELTSITIPIMVVSSDHDDVIDPANSDALAALVSGRVHRLRLANSAHVAALDLDRELLAQELLTWLVNLTDASASLPDESASS